MRSICFAAFLIAVAPFAAAAPVAGLVKGHTTVAEVEQGFGAPADTIMQEDGGLTLIYPYERLAAGPAKAHGVALVFGTDFVFRDARMITKPLTGGYAFK
jgi:hypothetical protein